MMNDRKRCQNDDLTVSSLSYPQILYLAHRVRKHGFVGTLNRLFSSAGLEKRPAPVVGKRLTAKTGISPMKDLNLQPGELVEVKTEKEIIETLDEKGKHKGLLFMPEMLKHCGGQFKVYKKLERMLIETTGEIRRMKNTVLLDGVLCDGWQGACDRSCFFFWREAWLRRIEQK